MAPRPQPPFTRDRLPKGVDPPAVSDPARLGAYRVVGRIGAGGMGAVYAGLHPDGDCAAVKVIHPRFAADPDFRARFAREVGMVSRVRARCAPALLGSDMSADTPWLATEYVPGLTLRQHVRRHGPLEGGMLTALAAGLAEALVAIHCAGVTHRDLKPGNVILAPDGPKVLDFGIARAADGTVLTRTGGLMGTPGWVAPEQYLGEEATEYSDMFAWAGLVAFAATGREPFGRGAVDAVSHRTRHEEPDLDGVPEHLLDPVRRGLAKEPGQRPTAEQALAELTDGWRSTRVQPARDQPPAQPPTQVVPEMLATEWGGVSVPETRRVGGRRRTLLLSGGAALTAAVLVGGWLFAGPDPESQGGQNGADTGADVNGAQAQEDLPTVQADPEDGAAVAAEAIELFEGAQSYEAVHRDNSSDRPSAYHVAYRYTEDPEPLYQVNSYGGPSHSERIEIGAGPEDVLLRSVSQLSNTDDEDYGYYRNQADAEAPRGEAQEPERILEDFALLTEPDAEITYRGQEEVPGGDEPEVDYFDPDTTGRTGHYYSGTFVEEIEDAAEGVEPEREFDFDLWVDEEGFPLRFTHFAGFGNEAEAEEEPAPEADPDLDGGGSGWDVFFVGINEPVEIDLPEESEIADSMEEANPEPGAGS